MTFWERSKTKNGNHEAEHAKSAMEDRCWEHAIFTDKLPNAFTDRVMQGLEGIDIEPVQEAKAHAAYATHAKLDETRPPLNDTSIAAQIKYRRTAIRYTRLKIWGTAAAAVFAACTLLYTQPTLAGMVRSLFAGNVVDEGMKHVQEAGLVQISGASATDQGYTLKVNEVIADSTRLIIGIDVYDDKGNALAGEIVYSADDFDVHTLQRGHFGDASFDIMSGGNSTTNRVEFEFRRPILTDKLQLNAKINELRIYKDTVQGETPIKTIKGNWELVIEADLAKAKTQTLTTVINQNYETPSGIIIQMQGATRTPSGGSLEFTTKLTPEAAARGADGQSSGHELHFHLEDEEGQWIEDSGMYDITLRSELDRWSGTLRWAFQFNDFAYDKQKIRFVLDNYSIREKCEAAVTFDPAKISAEQPVKFEDTGDKLLFKGLEIDDTGYARIPLGGTISNNISTGTWVAADENGKEYSVYYGGGISTSRSGLYTLDDGALVIHGLKKMPKQLTIKRLVVDHQYRDAQWSFVIPQTGTPGIFPE